MTLCKLFLKFYLSIKGLLNLYTIATSHHQNIVRVKALNELEEK